MQCHSAKYHSAECHSPLCHFAECHSAECLSAVSHYIECCFAGCHYAKCHNAVCYYAECRSAECRGILVVVGGRGNGRETDFGQFYKTFFGQRLFISNKLERLSPSILLVSQIFMIPQPMSSLITLPESIRLA
jgi:hypothetical protein